MLSACAVFNRDSKLFDLSVSTLLKQSQWKTIGLNR